MRDVSKAILEAGIVGPEAAAILERWGLMGARDLAEQAIKDRPVLVEALKEITRLVGKERGAYRHAYPGLGWDAPTVKEAWLEGESQAAIPFKVQWTPTKHLVVKRRDGEGLHLPPEGARMVLEEHKYAGPGGAQAMVIMSVDLKIYKDEEVDAILCVVHHVAGRTPEEAIDAAN